MPTNYCKDPASGAVPLDPFDEIGRAAAELALQPAPARAALSAERAAPASADPGPDPDALAQQVFAGFALQCATLDDAHGASSWERELRAGLADARLIDVAARQAFQQRIADLLAQGWRPGHHLLLSAASKVFEWGTDGRRVSALGAAGHTLRVANEQRALLDQQPDAVRAAQQRLIARLRDATPPATKELIDLMPTLATVEARFPAWLALTVDADNVARWHQLDQSLPSWRRMVRRRAYHMIVWPVLVALVVSAGILSGYGMPGRKHPAQAIVTQHLAQGTRFLDNDEDAKAVRSFDRVIQEDPDNASAYAGRAMALVKLSQKTRALADLEKLESLEPLSPVVPRARGLLAEKEGRHRDAIVAYTRSIKLDPQSAYTFTVRGYAYKSLGKLDKALNDADRALDIDPGRPWAHLLRARVFMQRKDVARAKAEAEAVLGGADRQGDAAYRIAAAIHDEMGDRPGALAVMDKAVAASPVAANYLNRSHWRPLADVAARRKDIQAALRLEPGSRLALRLLVRVEMQDKQWDTVVAAASRALALDSMKDDMLFLMSSRGTGYAKLGDTEKAAADFESARLAATSANDLNTLCYGMAVHDVALETALANCEASLEQEPGAWPTMDSKAFTLLRMKRYREALAVYDATVGDGRPNANPLYGRGVVKHRLGDRSGGQADIEAALAINPNIGADFALMGLFP
jgi:tetratricopeptide (TPR) repeat protein